MVDSCPFSSIVTVLACILPSCLHCVLLPHCKAQLSDLYLHMQPFKSMAQSRWMCFDSTGNSEWQGVVEMNWFHSWLPTTVTSLSSWEMVQHMFLHITAISRTVFMWRICEKGNDLSGREFVPVAKAKFDPTCFFVFLQCRRSRSMHENAAVGPQ